MRPKVLPLLSTLIVVVFLMGIEPNSRIRPLFLRNVLALRMTRESATVMLSTELPATTRLGEMISTISPDDWGVRRLLGTAYLQDGDIAKAISTLEADAIPCSDPLTCFLQGQALHRMNRKAEALSKWRATPHVDIFFALQGDHCYSRGARAEAARNYTLSWELSPTVTFSKRNMFLNSCREQRTGGHAAEAIEWCERAVRAGEDYWVLVELGRTYYEAGQYDLAEGSLREAINRFPEEPGAYHWLGATLFQVGNLQGAITALSVTTRLDPSNIWTQLELGNVLAAQGSYQEASCQYSKALALSEDRIQTETIREKMAQLPIDQTTPPTCTGSDGVIP